MNQALPDIRKGFAPTGTLRAAINQGNSVLAQKGPNGEALGVTADLARELAKRLGLPLELVIFDAAGKVFEALKAGKIDIVFLAIEPVRAARIAFTAPYITIEGVYLVPAGSSLSHADEVDRAGARIGVIAGSAYDLFLTRGLKHAELVRRPGPDEVRSELVEGRVDLIAGVKPALEADARTVPGSRLLPEAFMSIRQAMGTPREREAGAAYITQFIDDARRTGLLAELFARNRVEGGALA